MQFVGYYYIQPLYAFVESQQAEYHLEAFHLNYQSI